MAYTFPSLPFQVSSLVKARESAREGDGRGTTGSAEAGDRNNPAAEAAAAAAETGSNGDSERARDRDRASQNRPRLPAEQALGRQPNADTHGVDQSTTNSMPQSQRNDSRRRHPEVLDGSGTSTRPLQPPGAGVFNPYASASRATSNPVERLAAVAARSGVVESGEATPENVTQRQSRGSEVRENGGVGQDFSLSLTLYPYGLPAAGVIFLIYMSRLTGRVIYW